MRRRLACSTAILLLGFLGLAQVEAPHAFVNIVWRFAVLSFDNPATQALDELASTVLPLTPVGQAAVVVAVRSGRVGPPRPAGHPARPTLSSRLTRAPPPIPAAA